MTANVSQMVMDSMLPGVTYLYGELRDILMGNDMREVQLRNALVYLCDTRRLLRDGKRGRFRYYLNQDAAGLRADIGRTDNPRAAAACYDITPTKAPAWPLPRGWSPPLGQPLLAHTLESPRC